MTIKGSLKKRLKDMGNNVLVFIISIPVIIAAYYIGGMFEVEFKKAERLRFFKPIIRKNIWGSKYIEWQPRDIPLSIEEADSLIYDSDVNQLIIQDIKS